MTGVRCGPWEYFTVDLIASSDRVDQGCHVCGQFDSSRNSILKRKPKTWTRQRVTTRKYLDDGLRLVILLMLFGVCCSAQQSPDGKIQAASSQKSALQVNWLYGAYVPRGVELKPLSNNQRLHLYIRQTYLTWGIYAKTAFFALGDQATNSPPAWGRGVGGYGKRFGSRYGEFAIQNTLVAGGDGLLGYEPRYDRCRCSGGWPRIRHALARNFVTYNSTEHENRPQIALYSAALAAGAISSRWKPSPNDPWRNAYESMFTQAIFGSLMNLVGEFAPEITRLVKRR